MIRNLPAVWYMATRAATEPMPDVSTYKTDENQHLHIKYSRPLQAQIEPPYMNCISVSGTRDSDKKKSEFSTQANL